MKLDIANAEQNFAAAVEKMGALTGFDKKAIITAEAGSVLKRCFEGTKGPPSDAKLTVAGRLRALHALHLTGRGSISVNAGKKAPYGRVFIRKKDGDGFRRTHDDNFHPLNQHYTDKQWAELQNAVNDAKVAVAKVVPEVKASAGLARQSWDIIARSLGILLETIPGGRLSASAYQKARQARARGNKQVNNGASQVIETPTAYGVVLINRLPYGQKLGFSQLLSVAIAGRAKYMETAIAKGFNGALKDVSRLFPGWTVKS